MALDLLLDTTAIWSSLWNTICFKIRKMWSYVKCGAKAAKTGSLKKMRSRIAFWGRNTIVARKDFYSLSKWKIKMDKVLER